MGHVKDGVMRRVNIIRRYVGSLRWPVNDFVRLDIEFLDIVIS